MKTPIVHALLIVSIFLTPTLVWAAPKDLPDDLRGRYFMVVWAYQGRAPIDSHSFASFYNGDDLSKGQVAPATISWLSATGVVHPLQFEVGRNFSLTETLAMACQGGKRVLSWGPYEIKPELYQRALARIELLRSGKVAYSGIGFRPGAMNCIQAAGDIAPIPFRPGSSWGLAASETIVRHLRRFFKNGGQPNDTVAQSVMSNGCETVAKR
jgi:hypothetical protein